MNRNLTILVSVIAIITSFCGIIFCENNLVDYQPGAPKFPASAASYIDISPSWSPDGSKIAFYRSNDIYIMNTD